MRRRFLLSALTTALVVSFADTATAGLVGEVSREVASQDGRYLLVMVSPYSLDADWSSSALQAEVAIQGRYKQSGLYRNDESSELLWAVPYHIPVYEVYISPGGKHVVIAQEDFDHSVSNIPIGGSVSFYHQDGQSASYRDYDLTWCSALKMLTNNILGRNAMDLEEASFDPQDLTYTIHTDHGEEIVFDVASGEIVRHRSPWFLYLGVPLLAVPLAVFGLCHRGTRAAETGHDRRKSQVSLKEILLLITIICVLLGLMSISEILVIVCSASAFIGGGIAWIWSRTRRAWLIGVILSLYGGYVGLIIWSRLADFLFDPYGMVALWTFVAFGVSGVIGGGLLSGWVERRRNQVPAAA